MIDWNDRFARMFKAHNSRKRDRLDSWADVLSIAGILVFVFGLFFVIEYLRLKGA